MKVNLTKKHLTDLEQAVKLLKDLTKNAKGQVKNEIKDVTLSLNDILVRHDNRTEKEY